MTAKLSRIFFLAVLLAASARADYGIVNRYALGSEATGFDYLVVDSPTRRIFVARGDRIEVIHADTGKKLGEIRHTPRVHGVALAPECNHGFTSNALDRTVTMFDATTLETLAVIKYTGIKPDAIGYDAASKRVFVCNGASTGDVTVIDAATGAIVGTVDLGAGKLEQVAFDGAGRGYANDEARSAIHVFDTHTLKRIATWPLAPGESPTGLAIDAAHRRLFASCDNERLVVVNADSGAVVATVAIGADPDGTAFDPKTGHAFSANGDGTLTVIHQDDPDHYSVVSNLKTETNCRTIAVDAQTSRVFLPTAKLGPKPPPSKEPAPRPILPESFAIVVVAPR